MKILKYFSLFLIMFIVTVALAEVTFRLYHVFNPTFVFYDDAYNRWRVKPRSVDFGFIINSLGFKDVEFSVAKPNDLYRIIAIGDSFSYGVVPYQYNYLTVVENQLKSTNPNIEVMNMGIPGTGPRDYLALFVNEALAYRPDALLLTFFIGNDFDDNHGSQHLRQTSPFFVVQFLRFIFKLHEHFDGNVFHPPQLEAYQDSAPSFTPEAYMAIQRQRSWQYRTDRENQSTFATRLQDVLVDIQQIQAICQRENIALTIALAPSEIQVNSELQQQMMAVDGSQLSNSFDFHSPPKQLKNALEKANIGYIDLLPAFLEQGAQTPLYIPRNTHWNIAGNRLAAEVIRPVLQGHLLHERNK